MVFIPNVSEPPQLDYALLHEVIPVKNISEGSFVLFTDDFKNKNILVMIQDLLQTVAQTSWIKYIYIGQYHLKLVFPTTGQVPVREVLRDSTTPQDRVEDGSLVEFLAYALYTMRQITVSQGLHPSYLETVFVTSDGARSEITSIIRQEYPDTAASYGMLSLRIANEPGLRPL